MKPITGQAPIRKKNSPPVKEMAQISAMSSRKPRGDRLRWGLSSTSNSAGPGAGGGSGLDTGVAEESITAHLGRALRDFQQPRCGLSFTPQPAPLPSQRSDARRAGKE